MRRTPRDRAGHGFCFLAVWVFALVAPAACSSSDGAPATEGAGGTAGIDAGLDVSAPSTPDAQGGTDAAMAVPDAAASVSSDAMASPDAAADASIDAPVNASVDASLDSGLDSSADSGTTSRPDAAPPARPASPQLWFFAPFNLQVNANVTTLKGLLDRAAAAGYHGVHLADFKFNLLHTTVLADFYAANLADVLSYAATKKLEVLPGIFPFGYSEGILYQHPDWAEGLPVVGAPFTVQADRTLALAPSYKGPVNGGFETHAQDTFTGWSWQDKAGTRTIADTTIFHSGGVSARIDPGTGNARIVQSITLTPRRQYHVSFWLKTDAPSQRGIQVVVLDATSGTARNFNEIAFDPTQDWRRYDFTFNTMTSDKVNLYLGVWGDMASGRVWFDDVTLEETALVNVIRRPGAAVAARDGGGAALVEGTDIATVADPAIANGFNDWHTPPAIAVPAGSRLKAGDTVRLDYYAVAPVAGSQVGACLTEPAVDQWMQDNMAAVAKSFPAVQGFFLGHDEMRHMNSCASCAAKGLTAGQLLASHVDRAISVVRSAHPGARIHVWSDMFDPRHNAHADYYMVSGDIAGSWEGIGPDVVIMNWNLGNADSLKFFASRGHPQIISGYYDSGNGTDSATRELTAAKGVAGVQGMMYTTWQNDYAQLEAYANAARAAW
jgi:hypothetical protein